MAESTTESGTTDPLALWQRWSQATSQLWRNAPEGERGPMMDPYRLYRSWWNFVSETRRKAREKPRMFFDPQEAWNLWFDTTTQAWNDAVELGAGYFWSYANFADALSDLFKGEAQAFRSIAEHSPAPAHVVVIEQPEPNTQVSPAKQSTLTAELEIPRALPPIGARMERTRTITESDVIMFAEVSGDTNPIHLDEEFAARSQFGERIAHGFLGASVVSALLGNDLPGHGSIYLGQTLKFLAPVRIGDTITVSVEVVSIREDKHILTLRTDCVNQQGTLVFTGEATVKYKP